MLLYIINQKRFEFDIIKCKAALGIFYLRIFAFRLYSNHITDVGAKLVAQIIEECPKLRVVKYVCNLYQESECTENYTNSVSNTLWFYVS